MEGKYVSLIMLASAIFLLYSANASALSVAMDVGEELNADIKTINTTTENGVYWLSVEFYNSGSIGYKATARLDIFNGSKSIFTYWTDSREMVPGKKEYFDLYGYVPSSGNYSKRLRIYFANEVLEKWYSASQWTVSKREGIFTAKNPFSGTESGNEYLEFDLSSNQSIENVLILPSNYPRGWIFPGTKAGLEANTTYRQRLLFEPDMPSPGNISIIVVSSDGKYSNEYSFSLNNEGSMFSGFISFLVSLFHS